MTSRLLQRLAPSPSSGSRTNLWLSLIPVGVFILARAAIELEQLLGAGRRELDQLDAAIDARSAALAAAYAADVPKQPDPNDDGIRAAVHCNRCDGTGCASCADLQEVAEIWNAGGMPSADPAADHA